MTRPIRARIDLAALRHNHQLARRHMGSNRLWAVLKANAYGHGLLRCAQALAECELGGIGLVEIDSALALRAAGLHQPILLFEGCYSADEWPLLAEHDLIPVLHSMHQVDALCRAPLARPIPVYVKLNTGMNRLGLEAEELAGALARLKKSKRVTGITLMSHFAEADSGPEGRGISAQLQQFQRMSAGLDLPVCLANSAALLRYPETTRLPGAWARPGIMLYGAAPFPELKTAAELGLRPVMQLESALISVRSLKSGERIGYGGSFAAPQAMRIGVVACGYADGYPRHAPTGTPVLVAGQRTRTLGRVSMDKLCVDLTHLPEAAIGTPVELWGAHLPVDEVAQAAGTISYELLCALAARVPVVEV